MSHVVTLKTEIRDLDAAEAVIRELGGKLMRGQTTYKWWGRSMGDYPIPEGMTADQLGKCDHAIKVPGTEWEIGLVKNPKTGGYRMVYDFFGRRGRPILQFLGVDENGKRSGTRPDFMQMYAAQKATMEARKRGLSVQRLTVGGNIKLVCTGNL